MHAFIPDLSGPLQTFKPDVILALEADGAFIASQQATVGAVPIVVDQWEPSRIKTARILTRLRSLVFWRSIIKRMTAITVVTEQEKSAALEIVGIQPPTSVIENEAVRNSDYSRNPKPRSMLFCGNLDYIPNRAGILWFIRSVLPTIQKEMSGIHLEIVGHGAPLCPDGLPYGVTQRGWVDDISECYGSAALAINPVHCGHGSRVKNQCAIIHGVPLVTFPDGGASSSGPGVQMIDDADHTADAFSAACIEFLHNPPDIQLPRNVSPSETKLVASLENLLEVAAGVLG